MNESRATSSFLPSGLSPSAPDYGSLEAFTGSTLESITRGVAGSPRRTLLSGSPPVREFHPPPKATRAKYHTVMHLTSTLPYGQLVSTPPPIGSRLSAFQLALPLSCCPAALDARERRPAPSYS